MDGLTTFDIIIGATILFLGLKGILDGFIKELFALIGIIGGIYIGSHYNQDIGIFIDQNIFHIKNEAALSFIGFLIGLILFWIAMIILGKFFAKLINLSGLSIIDKLLGFLFGAAKIFLIFSVIAYAIYNIEATKKVVNKYTKNSLFFPLMLDTGSYIVKVSPKELKQKVEKKSEEIKSSIKNSAEKESIKTIKNKIKNLENNKSR